MLGNQNLVIYFMKQQAKCVLLAFSLIFTLKFHQSVFYERSKTPNWKHEFSPIINHTFHHHPSLRIINQPLNLVYYYPTDKYLWSLLY